MVSARKRKQMGNPQQHADQVVGDALERARQEAMRRRVQRDPDMGAVMGETPDVDVPAHPRGPIRA